MVDEISSGGISNPTIITTGPTPPQTEPTVNEPPENSVETFGDTLLQAEEPAEVSLLINGQIDLPPGRISIRELQEIIQETIQKLKRAIIDAQQLDPLISERWHRALAFEAQSLEDLHSELLETVERWKQLETKAKEIYDAHSDLEAATIDFNNFMTTVWSQDRAAIQDLNAILNTYNHLTPQGVTTINNSLSQAEKNALLAGLTEQEIEDLGGEEYAVAFQYINQKIGEWNQYVANRPDVQEAINNIVQQTTAYNELINDYNTLTNSINAERAEFGLPNLPFYDSTPVPNPQPLYTTLPSQPEITVPLIPSNATERLTLFLQKPTEERTDDFIAALDAINGVTPEQANTAVAEATANGPYATESAFFGAVRTELGVLFDPPSDGYQKFDQALNGFPMRYGLEVPSSAQIGTISSPIYPGDPIDVNSYELTALFFIPLVNSFLGYTSLFRQSLSLEEAVIANEIFFQSLRHQNLTLPFGYFDTLNPVFQAGANSIGGLGLASAAMGLQSRHLQIVLSRILFRESAANASLPISARLYSRLQFTALEILSKSSLMSSMPALRFVASRLGSVAAQSPAVFAAISLAYAGQVGAIVDSGLFRIIVNGQINRLGFYARQRFGAASRNLQAAQRELALAIKSGNPFRMASAVDRLTQAEVELSNATRLFNAFGLTSIGHFASLSTQLAAGLNLSLLGISSAFYARALGIPNLVPLIFAQVSQLPPQDLLIALTSRATLSDVLENPISLVFAKQTLTNLLVHRLGYSAAVSAAIVNNAINHAIYSGVGLNTISSFRNELVRQFTAEGVNPLQANLLANETVALIRGDIGARYLNIAFGLNMDTSAAAASLVNSLFGVDIGIGGAMLSNAITRSLQYGGYGSRVRLQNELFEQFRDFGLSRGDALAYASQTLNFYETVGIVVPLTRFPGLTNALLGDPLLRSIALGQGLVRKEILEDLQTRGLSNTQAEFITDQLLALASGNFVLAPETVRFELALRGAINRALVNPNAFETQREFRNRLREELRAVGFSLNDAIFLANSTAAYNVNGAFLPVTGVSASKLQAVNSAFVGELTNNGISRSQANLIFEHALKQANQRAPFFSSDDFLNILKEEVFSTVQTETGRGDGSYLFDRAVASVLSASQTLSLDALVEQISNSATGVLRPDLGGALASRLRDQILVSILGGRTIDEISNEEQRNPLSIVNLVTDQVRRLRNEEDDAEQIRMLRKLIQLLEKLATPNASIGYLLSSLGDNPGTFIGAANVSKAGENYQALQIPT
ncbi:putative uncharacterized protein [Waddlia chondrophila 2032/99]|uniref:Uncharacterized protein n=1 Tax=Waddlia chondrophila 2032/99 TaxID=765953 RepID=F8LAA7_9BACT|nr:putative uncharacterized protein [Waddlia chondrophila 2032/99]